MLQDLAFRYLKARTTIYYIDKRPGKKGRSISAKRQDNVAELKCICKDMHGCLHLADTTADLQGILGKVSE